MPYKIQIDKKSNLLTTKKWKFCRANFGAGFLITFSLVGVGKLMLDLDQEWHEKASLEEAATFANATQSTIPIGHMTPNETDENLFGSDEFDPKSVNQTEIDNKDDLDYQMRPGGLSDAVATIPTPSAEPLAYDVFGPYSSVKQFMPRDNFRYSLDHLRSQRIQLGHTLDHIDEEISRLSHLFEKIENQECEKLKRMAQQAMEDC